MCKASAFRYMLPQMSELLINLAPFSYSHISNKSSNIVLRLNPKEEVMPRVRLTAQVTMF